MSSAEHLPTMPSGYLGRVSAEGLAHSKPATLDTYSIDVLIGGGSTDSERE